MKLSAGEKLDMLLEYRIARHAIHSNSNRARWIRTPYPKRLDDKLIQLMMRIDGVKGDKEAYKDELRSMIEYGSYRLSNPQWYR